MSRETATAGGTAPDGTLRLPKVHSGKVRDSYDAGEGRLLMVTSDRISAFDVVMAEPIPDKGRVLTGLTVYWLQLLSELAPSHLLSVDAADFPPEAAGRHDLEGRAMLVRRAEMLPLECIVRGYLSGSAWREYSRSGTMHGMSLPGGLQESDRLPEPVFTPSTKAIVGHDENISVEEAARRVGTEVVERARRLCLDAYEIGANRALDRGIIVADTKFELGFIDGELSLCDEVLTPDSSRFWPVDGWLPGSTPPSFDKQPLRDWLETTGWDKTPPPPSLPGDVVKATARRYREAYERITGDVLVGSAAVRSGTSPDPETR